jgi:hypothetical protein
MAEVDTEMTPIASKRYGLNFVSDMTNLLICILCSYFIISMVKLLHEFSGIFVELEGA